MEFVPNEGYKLPVVDCMEVLKNEAKKFFNYSPILHVDELRNKFVFEKDSYYILFLNKKYEKCLEIINIDNIKNNLIDWNVNNISEIYYYGKERDDNSNKYVLFYKTINNICFYVMTIISNLSDIKIKILISNDKNKIIDKLNYLNFSQFYFKKYYSYDYEDNNKLVEIRKKNKEINEKNILNENKYRSYLQSYLDKYNIEHLYDSSNYSDRFRDMSCFYSSEYSIDRNIYLTIYELFMKKNLIIKPKSFYEFGESKDLYLKYLQDICKSMKDIDGLNYIIQITDIRTDIYGKSLFDLYMKFYEFEKPMTFEEFRETEN